MTTLEEASRCPKCEKPGKPAGKSRAKGASDPRAELHTFVCVNQLCRWSGQVCRVVQINSDGSIPEPAVIRTKQYPKVPDLTEQVNRQLEEQIRAETAGN